MREALRSLQSIGLVKIEHGSGVYITGTRPSTELSSHFQNVGEGQLIALAETRCILEPELAALAAERGTDDELTEIEGLVRQMEEEDKHGHDYPLRSEEHTSELQSHSDLVCRLLLEKKQSYSHHGCVTKNVIATSVTFLETV